MILCVASCSDTNKDQSANHATDKPHAQTLEQKATSPEADAVQPLDLHVTSLIDTPPADHVTEISLLPPLFDQQTKVAAVQMGGRLITDDKIEDPIESVEGAEVSIDFLIP